MSNNKYNGETLIVSEFIHSPIPENSMIFFNHYGRYYYAMKRLGISSEDFVLDASCGNGYGSYALAHNCHYVYGVDINKDYLDMAKDHFKKDNLQFITYEDLYDDIVYADKIVCIESLEHVPKEEMEEFIRKLFSKLVEGGSAFVTVPLGNNEASEYNKFHLNEPSIDVAYELFSKYFEKINIEVDSFVNSFGYECKYAFLILKDKK
jgi:2-polyprenyl-3-methyl-5-hydroxy-6-metoxy-1,4-benzoquinol methylase